MVPEQAGLVAHLQMLEEQLLQPQVRHSRAAVAALLAPEFCEIGSSGRLFDRPAILAALEAEGDVRRALSEFQLRLLAPGLALVIYRASRYRDEEQSDDSWRSSIWQLRGERWQLLFHQGTSL